MKNINILDYSLEILDYVQNQLRVWDQQEPFSFPNILIQY